MLMYEQGFRWWRLGLASAIAFVLFAAHARRDAGADSGCKGGSRHEATLASIVHMHAGDRGDRRWWCLRRCVWMVGGRRSCRAAQAQTYPPPLVAQPSRRSDNFRELFSRLHLGRYFFNSARRSRWRSPRLGAAAQLDGRLRLRQAAVSRPRPAVQLAAGGPGRAAAGRHAAAVPAAEADGADQHLLGRDFALDGRPFTAFSWCGNTPCRFPTACSTPPASTAPGELRIFFSIVLPLLRPVLATLGIFTFLSAWNDFMWPLIVLTGNDRYTLPVALAILSERARAGRRADDGRLGGDHAAGARRCSLCCKGS